MILEGGVCDIRQCGGLTRGKDQVISVRRNVGRVCVSKGQLVVPLRVQRGQGQGCTSTFPLGDLRLGLAGSQDARVHRGH